MPRGDGTGPMGYGPMTGRGFGYCAGYAVPGYMHPGFGRWFRYGRGRGLGYGRALALAYGRGYGWGFLPPYAAYGFVPPAPPDEREALKREADYLKGELDAIEARLAEINDRLKKMSKSDKTESDDEPDSKPY